jgi:hypothetical protein
MLFCTSAIRSPRARAVPRPLLDFVEIAHLERIVGFVGKLAHPKSLAPAGLAYPTFSASSDDRKISVNNGAGGDAQPSTLTI